MNEGGVEHVVMLAHRRWREVRLQLPCPELLDLPRVELVERQVAEGGDEMHSHDRAITLERPGRDRVPRVVGEPPHRSRCSPATVYPRVTWFRRPKRRKRPNG